MSEAKAGSMPAATEVEMVGAKEVWSEYRLADGTTLRVKPVMIAVFRTDGQQSADGEPAYNTKSTLIMDVRTPGPAAESA